MPGQGSTRWRGVLAALLLPVWVFSAHLASAGIGPVDVHTVVAVTPLLVAEAVWLGQLRRRVLVIALGGLTAATLAVGWGWLRGNLPWLYYLQHLGTHLALGAWFGRSLAPGREPVVTALARLMAGGAVSERKRRYTRGVTAGWTAFFFLNALVSTALFAWAPTPVWSVHANVLTGPLIGLVFLIELLVRRCVLPPAERPRLRDIVEAWRTHGRPRQRRGSVTP